MTRVAINGFGRIGRNVFRASLERYSDEPLASRDIVHSPYSCVFDSFGWDDNEWGYSCRLVDLVDRLV